MGRTYMDRLLDRLHSYRPLDQTATRMYVPFRTDGGDIHVRGNGTHSGLASTHVVFQHGLPQPTCHYGLDPKRKEESRRHERYVI